MKISIIVKDEIIWMRDGFNKEGVASQGYMKDGTQKKIIAALEDALAQAKGEALSWDDADTMLDTGCTSA
ncbi:Rrf2 family transcriptional regulator [Pantoea agglomerans]|uniref:Rrf2 family transcriptional regulator n=1 Tax=Enterobacter agglomerans TaxID=549 RepID=UPI00289A30B2|nr:Rrf2 family transcriptional regulator [Pantoea agglomerans]WNK36857.1 Rrf2 family transcriptional regulator [Pantoea agglomerans]